jgi:hypothetical protein
MGGCLYGWVSIDVSIYMGSYLFYADTDAHVLQCAVLFSHTYSITDEHTNE